MANFEIGEVVVLKSGGPRMTVHNIGDYASRGLNPGVLCVWFEKNKRMEDAFHPLTLERYSDEMPEFGTAGPLA